MRGIFWWNRKMDRSWETMEKDTSPFKGSRKHTARNSKRKYPELHRTFLPHDERFEAPSSEVVGTIVVLICIGLVAVVAIVIASINPLYALLVATPGALIAAGFGIRWKLRHKTRWKKKQNNEQE